MTGGGRGWEIYREQISSTFTFRLVSVWVHTDRLPRGRERERGSVSLTLSISQFKGWAESEVCNILGQQGNRKGKESGREGKGKAAAWQAERSENPKWEHSADCVRERRGWGDLESTRETKGGILKKRSTKLESQQDSELSLSLCVTHLTEPLRKLCLVRPEDLFDLRIACFQPQKWRSGLSHEDKRMSRSGKRNSVFTSIQSIQKLIDWFVDLYLFD